MCTNTQDALEKEYLVGLEHFRLGDYQSAFRQWQTLGHDLCHAASLCDLGYLCNEGKGTDADPRKVLIAN